MTDQPTTEPEPARAVTLDRGQLAGLLAHHADVLAARWYAVAPGPGAWEIAAALALRSHANELTAEEEPPAVAELLDSMLSCPVESATPAPGPHTDQQDAEPQMLVPCGLAVLNLPNHTAHSWQPQSGMDLVRCEGSTPSLYARERAAHEEHRRSLAGALCHGLHESWDGLIRQAARVQAENARLWAESDQLAADLQLRRGNDEVNRREAGRRREALASALGLGRNAHWDAITERAGEVQAHLADYENRLTWETNCGEHAKLLDACAAAEQRAEQAEAALTDAQQLADRLDDMRATAEGKLARVRTAVNVAIECRDADDGTCTLDHLTEIAAQFASGSEQVQPTETTPLSSRLCRMLGLEQGTPDDDLIEDVRRLLVRKARQDQPAATDPCAHGCRAAADQLTALDQETEGEPPQPAPPLHGPIEAAADMLLTAARALRDALTPPDRRS